MSTEVKSMQIKENRRTMEGGMAIIRRLQSFIADVKAEIYKITWTGRDELIVYTKIVVIATFLFGMAIYLLDLMIQGFLGTLSAILHFIS